MYCCIKCFKDKELKLLFKGIETIGTCDFCKSKNVPLIDLGTNSDLRELFVPILDLYQLQKNNKNKNSLNLIQILSLNWNIFNLTQLQIKTFFVELFPDRYKDNPNILMLNYELTDFNNTKLLSELSLLFNCNWEDFVNEIKYKIRFHTSSFNKKIFYKILEVISVEYKPEEKFYRARIWNKSTGYSENEMGPPPKEKTLDSRANSTGIPLLYLGDSIKTVKYESRAFLYDNLSIGTFELLKTIKIIDFTKIGSISPFRAEDNEYWSKVLAINNDNLKKIEKHIATPHRRNDTFLDYLPTQFICDYINSTSIYAGIKYKSTLYKNGYNLAIFDKSLFKCIKVENIEITAIKYTP